MILLPGIFLSIILLIATFYTNLSAVVIYFVETVVIILDILTVLPSLILHLSQKSKYNTPKIMFSIKDDNDYIRIGKRSDPSEIIGNSTTFKELAKFCFNKYFDQPLFGIREILQVHYEMQGDRKIKKLLLANEYKFLTYKQTNLLINSLIKTFIDEGIKPRDKVIIFSETRLEWLLSFLALSQLNAVVVTLYSNLDNKGILHILQETESKYIVASEEPYKRLKILFTHVNHIQKIFLLDDLTQTDINQKYEYRFFSDKIKKMINKLLINNNDESFDDKTNIILPEATPTDEILIMYTSGSQGVPKGVLLSHQNIISSISCLYSSSLGNNMHYDKETFLAYLPQAHIFELCCELLHLLMGFRIVYSSPLTMLDTSFGLKTSSKGDVTICKPTTIPMVPLMLCRIKNIIETNIKNKGETVWKIFNFFLARKKFWAKYGFSTPISDKLVFGKIRRTFGGRWKITYVGSAPLSSEIQCFIKDTLGLCFLQGYGATETAAIGTIMDSEDNTLGTVGAVTFGCRIRLIDWKSGGYLASGKPPRGQILISSNSLTSGYFNRPKENEKSFITLDGRRYWKSGDIGEITEEGNLKIIDRKKNLIKLQNGEYVALGKIEAVLKNCKYIENICICANGLYDYLVALVTLNAANIKALASVKTMNTSESNGFMEKKLIEIFQKIGVKEGLTYREIPKKIKICHEEWTTENQLITTVQKVRRNNIYSYYKKYIDELYES